MSHHTIEIRGGVAGDQPSLNAVMRSASLAVESGEVLRLLLAEPQHLEVDISLLERGQVVVATVEGEPAGFASYLVGGRDEAELDGMFVDPKYWRRGLGRLMFGAVERELMSRNAIGIRVAAGASAVDFYKAVGFVIIGEQRTALGPVVPVMRKAFRALPH